MSACERWPIIVGQAADEVRKSADGTEGAKKQEGHKIADQIAALRLDILNNEELRSGFFAEICSKFCRPLGGPGKDIAEYNEELAFYKEMTWQNAPWLFSECYLYRLIQSMFWQSIEWKDYDVFKRQKDSTFEKSKAAVQELATRYLELQSTLMDNEARRGLFVGFCILDMTENDRSSFWKSRFGEMQRTCHY